MEWDSPWGKGFPGWHIECSAMSMHYLGPTLDIHTGGIDHIPTHHTNEIAQSEAATGKRFATYWLHSNHVLIDNEKISKSLNNGIRLEDIVKHGIPLEAVRLHILESHYRNQSKFSWESLQAAHNRLKDLRAMAALRFQAVPAVQDAATFALEDVPVELTNIVAQDINTPGALALLSQVTTQLLSVHIETDMVDHFEAMLKGIDDLLGLSLMSVQDITDEQKQLIGERQAAREASDWAKSDEIRDQLIKEGVGLRDTERGVTWFPAS
jgi:cysteinyl-tRNA synthetase